MKKVFAILLAMVMLLALCACGNSTGFTTKDGKIVPIEKTDTTATESKEEAPETDSGTDAAVDVDKLNVVIETALGDIHVELNPDVAPITVANFQKLVGEGFYDGLTFHRVIDGFMIQGGDPNGDGTGGAPDKIKGEFSANGVNNPLQHVRGVISMARSADMNSASSQFFIMHADAPHLDGQYAAFGAVTSGMEVVDAVVNNSVVEDSNGTVLKANQIKIKRIYFK